MVPDRIVCHQVIGQMRMGEKIKKSQITKVEKPLLILTSL